MALPTYSEQGKVHLKDKSPSWIADFMTQLGQKSYRGEQISSWLFKRGGTDFAEMTDISKATRDIISRVCSVSPLLSLVKDEDDGLGARRFLWRLTDGQLVESVLLKELGHYTLCVSSQVGCRMGCRFCRTGTLGFRRNLSQGEIIEQITGIKKLTGSKCNITNIDFMGMGEPLDNADNVLSSLNLIVSPKYLAISANRVSLSTVGVIPEIIRLTEAGGLKGGLTISLGSADNKTRDNLMPANKKWPLEALKEALTLYPLTHGRRLTFAYVLLSGINDSPAQAKKLTSFLSGLKTKINLIPFNPWPKAPFKRPTDQAVEAFQAILADKYHTVLIRDTKGASINAACGLLVADQVPTPTDKATLVP
jgi:23S rRNA (adenine2503-C2)-methyltransferase